MWPFSRRKREPAVPDWTRDQRPPTFAVSVADPAPERPSVQDRLALAEDWVRDREADDNDHQDAELDDELDIEIDWDSEYEDSSEEPTFTPMSNRIRFELPSDGRVPVVGESHYQKALRIAVDGKAAGDSFDSRIPVTAALIPEPENQWDSDAVRVDIVVGNSTVKVGYLSSEYAGEFQSILLPIYLDGQIPTCQARVAGGGDAYYGIYLYLNWPRTLAYAIGQKDPVVASEQSGVVRLRDDWFCTVTREEDHQEILAKYMPKSGEDYRQVVCELMLESVEIGKKKRRDDRILVRLDGEKVGILTAAMTERYKDIVTGIVSDGRVVTCDAYTRRSSKGVEIELRMPRDPNRPYS